MPDQMLRWVWNAENGEALPVFKSNRQVQTVINLIIRHYQNVNDALNAGVLAPRISESGIEAWCSGYYVELQPC